MGVPSSFTKVGDIKPEVVVIGTGFGAAMTIGRYENMHGTLIVRDLVYLRAP